MYRDNPGHGTVFFFLATAVEGIGISCDEYLRAYYNLHDYSACTANVGGNPMPIKQEINCNSAIWNINGVSYELSVFGVNDISTDELVEMAKEMISAE